MANQILTNSSSPQQQMGNSSPERKPAQTNGLDLQNQTNRTQPFNVRKGADTIYAFACHNKPIGMRNLKTLIIALAMLAIGNAFAQNVGETFVSNGITYKITSLSPNEVKIGDDNNVAVSNPTGSYVLPNSVQGGTGNLTYSVTAIGDGAFGACSNLTAVTIPNTVTIIGNFAFFGTGLTSITFPESVTTIRWGAFYHCLSLTSVTIPTSVTTMGAGTFAECFALTELNYNAVNCSGPDLVHQQHHQE
ncbi:MAG: leucine-rich repeat domain-containing protein [Bacteroidales bacterium]|jgi:hypothetical protein|nr:leucine-rich repeat domain-containing protein [Bacteroidales bacterium]